MDRLSLRRLLSVFSLWQHTIFKGCYFHLAFSLKRSRLQQICIIRGHIVVSIILVCPVCPPGKCEEPKRCKDTASFDTVYRSQNLCQVAMRKSYANELCEIAMRKTYAKELCKESMRGGYAREVCQETIACIPHSHLLLTSYELVKRPRRAKVESTPRVYW